MLNLTKKNPSKIQVIDDDVLPHCEICGEQFSSLDKAHWKENAKGGSTRSNNILNLCPNCHRKLDRGDKEVIEKGRKSLLFREVNKLFQARITKETPDALLELCTRIIKDRSST